MRRHREDGSRDVAQLAICASDDDLRGRIETTLVAGGHEVVACIDSVQELTDLWNALDAELLVLTCELRPLAPLREITVVRSWVVETPIVVVTTGILTGAARRLVRADVQGLVHESDLEDALVATVDSVLAEQLCVPAALREVLAQPVFSHREKQVLELVLEGLTNGEIASRMYLSESTVKSHLASSFRKLGVSSRAEASRRLLELDREIDPTPAWITDPPTVVRAHELT